MKLSLLQWLCCPGCKGALDLVKGHQVEEEIEEGLLSCTECTSRYPIRQFIPRFVEDQDYAESFGFQWNRFRRTQLDSQTGKRITRARFLRQTGWEEDSLRGLKVLDAGCGAGRFAEIALSMGAEVFAVDYSQAVEACFQNTRRFRDVHVIQADIYRLPFRRELFDRAYCFGVLQHTPSPRAAFHALAPPLKPGGLIAVDVYERRWTNIFVRKYSLRPLTKRLPEPLLFRLLERAVPSLLWLSRVLPRFPLVGRALRRLVPVANYERIYPLSAEHLRQWALLDTFDMLSPAHDHPQQSADVKTWFQEEQFQAIDVFSTGLVVGRARKPVTLEKA